MFQLKYKIERSIVINKDIDSVFDCVANFNSWASWSPWLCLEKGAETSVEGEPQNLGHKQSWQGQRIGSGKIAISNLDINKSLHYDLEFLKPFKSSAKVDFYFEQQASGTRVRWLMQSSVPFYLFFLKDMLAAMLGNDYERGLSMLKEFLETGEVLSEIDMLGKIQKPAFHYLGVRRSSSIDELPKIMQQDFELIHKYMQEGKIKSSQQMISFYHKFDFMRNQAVYTNAVVYDSEQGPYTELKSGYVPNHHCAQVLHTGSYENLGNAWSAIMNYQRFEKLKANKNIPWYEWYINSPKEVEKRYLKTSINLPIK